MRAVRLATSLSHPARLTQQRQWTGRNVLLWPAQALSFLLELMDYRAALDCEDHGCAGLYHGGGLCAQDVGATI